MKLLSPTKKLALGLSILIAVLLPLEVAAAQLPNRYTLPGQYFSPDDFWQVPTAPPINHPPIKAELSQSWKNPYQLTFTVTNPTSKTIELKFPTAKEYDVTLRNIYGWPVWRASQGRSYAQVEKQDRLEPYQSRVYEVRLPLLPGGVYIAEATFEGCPIKTVVARSRVVLPDPLTKLEYKLYFSYLGWLGGQLNRKLVFTVKNPTDSDMLLGVPAFAAMDIVIVSDQGEVWRYSDNRQFLKYPYDLIVNGKWYDPEDYVLPAGAARTYFIKLPDLPPGWHEIQAYFANSLHPVATLPIYVRKK